MLNKSYNIAAIVVAYHPSEHELNNISKLCGLVNKLFVVDNSEYISINKKNRVALLSESNIEVHSDGINKGMSAALNIGIKKANALGYKRVFMFDQDTSKR
jgi:GT2 family glycosyltransferase